MASSSGRYPNNLPHALSSFVGRGHEIMQVKQLFSAACLVTLTGPGGCGKTRLALWVAAELGASISFADGVWLVELASLSDPDLVSQAVATVLGIREQSGFSLNEVLADAVSSREILLVLDNCEHLVTACAQLAETLLRAGANLRILATSRESLNISGEKVWPVPSLSTPSASLHVKSAGLSGLLQYESIRLFIERASSASPQFSLTDRNAPAVVEICQRLDGMPLAIELAAARARTLSVEQIASRLATHDRFHLLTVGHRTAPPRQQTLEATLDWSYALLSETERKVLQCLSVFAGGCTLEAAEAVCAAVVPATVTDKVMDVLSHLIDKSLVVVDRLDGDVRCRLLETIRQYARSKLVELGAAEQVRDQHLSYFVSWSEQADQHLTGADQLTWLNRCEVEHDNVRAALEWSQISEQRAEQGLLLAGLFARFWRLRGYFSEGRMRVSAALGHPGVQQPHSAARARALFWAGNLAYLQSDYPATRALCEESLAILRQLGPPYAAWTAEVLAILGEVATEEGDYATAPVLLEQALSIWRDLQDTRGIGDALLQLGWAAMRTGNYALATSRLEESLAFSQQVGYKTLIALALAGLGEAAVRQGQYEHATPLLEESLALRRAHGEKWGIGTTLGTLGWVALQQRDFTRMRLLLGESLNVRMEIGDRGGIAWCLEKLAEALMLQTEAAPSISTANLMRAVSIFGAAAALRAPVRSVIDPAD